MKTLLSAKLLITLTATFLLTALPGCASRQASAVPPPMVAASTPLGLPTPSQPVLAPPPTNQPAAPDQAATTSLHATNLPLAEVQMPLIVKVASAAAPVVETVVPQPWGAIAGGLISLASSVAAMYAARHSRSAATASATATAMLNPTPGPDIPKKSS